MTSTYRPLHTVELPRTCAAEGWAVSVWSTGNQHIAHVRSRDEHGNFDTPHATLDLRLFPSGDAAKAAFINAGVCWVLGSPEHLANRLACFEDQAAVAQFARDTFAQAMA